MFASNTSRALAHVALIAAASASAQDVAPGQAGSKEFRNEQAARAEALVIDEVHVRAADTYQRTDVRHTYRFENRGDETVRVLETVVVSGEADLSVEPTVIAPGASGVIRLRQPLGDRLGETAFRYAILTDESGGARYRFTLTVFVQSAYDPEVPVLDFGVVERTTGGAAEFELFSREVDRLAIAGAVGAPDYLEVTVPGRIGVTGEGAVVRASIAPNAPEGYLSGSFSLRAGVPHQPEVLVQWRAIVAGGVVPTENPLDLGIADIGYEHTRQLRLVSRDGRPFRVQRLDADDALAFADGPCPDADDGQAALCRDVSVSWTPQGRQRLGGSIRVYLEGREDPITVRYRGISVPPGTEIRELKPIDAFGDPE